MIDNDSGGKLPHQSFTIQATLAQSALITIILPFLPLKFQDPQYILAWMTISTIILRFVSKNKIIWYGSKK